jgi:copper transport protein
VNWSASGRRILRLVLAVSAILLAAHPSPVAAHALLLRSEPAAGVVGAADQPPKTVVLWFSEPVDVTASGGIAVLDTEGRRVDHFDAHAAAADPRQVEVSLSDLAQGSYAVRWRATSADNHVISGTFWFGVGFATAVPPSALLAAGAPTLPALETVARWLSLVAVLALAGGAFFDVLVRAPVERRLGATGRGVFAEAAPSLARVAVLGGVLLVAAHAAWAAAQMEAVAELPLPRALDGPVARAVLLESRFGLLWWARILLGLILAARLVADARSRRTPAGRARWVDAALGVALVVAFALGGHASGARELPAVAVGVDAIHLAAAAVWLGGLAQLVGLLPAILGTSPDARATVARVLVPRISGLALVAVGVLIATGVFSAWEQAGTFEAATTTAYGQTLLLKIGVLLPLLAIAGVNRFVLRPRLVAGLSLERLTRRFGSLVRGELLLGGVVLGFAAALGSLPPPGPQGLPGPIEVARQAGDLRVQLSVSPNWVGVSRFRVSVTDAQGQPAPDVRDVVLTFTMEGMNMGRTTVPAAATQPGVFEADGFYIGMPGVAQIGVAVSRTSGADESAVFRIETPNVTEQQYQGLGPTLALQAAAERPPGTAPADLAQGQAVYGQHCAVCHGDTGIGNGPAAASLLPPPADLTLHARWHSDDQLFWFITHGVAGTPMPSFADQLSPGQRRAVIAHLHVLAAAPTASSPREAPVGPAQVAAPTPPPARDELIGRIVFAPDTDKDFWIWRFPSDNPERLARFTRLDFASFPTWSPDGQRLAFSFYQLPRVGAIPAGTDLYLMNADGTDMHPLAMHDTPGAALLYPAWAPDGNAVYVTHQARRPEGGADSRIERVDVRSGERETVIPNAAYASASRDGRRLAYAAVPNADGSGQSLWISGVDRSDAREILPAGVFVRFSSLRFAPDGQRLLFAAVGQGTTYTPPAAGRLDLLGLLDPMRSGGVAHADGEEWDLWTIDPDGRNLRRVTNLAEDLPVASWSPSGGSVVFLGGGSARTAETGLAVVAADGSNLRRLTTRPGHRGADWAPVP